MKPEVDRGAVAILAVDVGDPLRVDDPAWRSLNRG
jgi:hypothetical protein